MTKICKLCGKEFEGYCNRKYCSECKIIKRKEWDNKHREYNKRYYKKYRDEIMEKSKEYRQKQEVIERRREYMKKYYKRPEVEERRREYYKEFNKKYYKKNKDILLKKQKESKKEKGYYKEYLKEYNKKYPERRKARSFVYNNKQKGNECLECGSTKNLDFHHTNYEKNEGITLCRSCHNIIHKK